MATRYDEAYYQRKIEGWEESLLDFSMRNKLLNLKTTPRSGALAMSEPGWDAIWNRLACSGQAMQFPSRTRADYERELKKYNDYIEDWRNGTLADDAVEVPEPQPFELDEGELVADVPARDMQRRLKSIRQRARLLREERGLDTLYLAFGTVRWRDLQNKPHDAPAVLLPVELDARSRSSAFSIKATDEVPSGNVTFRLYAKDSFDLEVPEFAFASVPTVDELTDYLDLMERTVQPMGWRVERTVALSVFSFANISMYRDLVDNADKITSHPVVRAICGDTAALRQQERDLAPIDEVRASSSKVNPGESFQVVDADSSQEYAIQLANAGYSFVLQGPPGTGKSQTITNIISEAIAHGKTVLFVSEKRAALDVVYTRLEQAGLKDYVYVLHDVNQNKKEAIKDLARQLESKGDDDALDSLTGSSAEEQRYELDRDLLDGYATEMSEVIQPFNKSIWDVCNELIRLQDQGAPVIRFSLEDAGKLSDREFAGMRDAAGDLGHARGTIKGPVLEHPWRGIAPHAMTEDFKLDAQDVCINYLSAIDGLLNAFDEADQLGTKSFDRREGAARSLVGLLKHLDGVSGLEQLLVSPNLNRTRASLKRLEAAKSRYLGRCDAFEDACSKVDGITYSSISPGSLELLAAQLNEKIAADPAFKRWDGLSEQAQGQLRAKVQELEGELQEVRAARDEILREYSDDVLDIDARSMLSDFEGVGGKYSTALARKFTYRTGYRKACDRIGRCRRHWSKDEITYDEVCALLHQLEAYQSNADQFEERSKEYERWFPGLYNGLDTDTGEILARIEEFDALQNLKDSTSELLTILHSYEDDLDDAAEAFGMDECGLEADFSKMVRAVDSIREIRVSTDDLAVDVQKLVDLGSKRRKRIAKQLDAALAKLDAASGPFMSLFLTDARPESDDLLALRERVEGCEASINDLEYMMSYARNRSYCCMCGLGSFVAAAEREDLSSEAYVPAFERRAYVLWFEEVSKSHPTVADFSSAVHADDRREFCECDESLLGQTRQRVIARVHASLVEASDSDEAQTLKREANKRTRVWPVRKVFSELPELACKLKPCMMMSPLSVSTFLESRSIAFDLVVFDEASQVRTEDAVGAISRGRQAIIAGDSHQLPPTSFFETTSIVSDDGEVYEDDEDEATQIGAFDSVLEEAAALHGAPLNLHYRSRNESLISFSNDEIYDGRLVTFPSSYEQRRGEGVSFAYVSDGVWRGARSGNPVEARRVAELVFEHFKRFPERSVGVIALGSGQAQLIDDEIDALRAEKLAKHDHSFEKFFNENRPEPFFVKNLENVQGDERDSIFLSVGYGRNAAGKLIQNFGPINQKGGERRLNVAVTRAKHDLTLVSSMKGSDISVDTASRGPQLLHDYLEYAERCEASGGVAENRFVVGSQSASASSSGPYIASYIERELKERGCAVDRSIGTSICRIDLGVKRDAGDTDYLLGILLDGPGYAQTDSARDRERIQPEMLQGMGWDLYRVWVQDWERHPEKSMEELLSRVDELAADYVDRHPTPALVDAPIVENLADELPEKSSEEGFETEELSEAGVSLEGQPEEPSPVEKSVPTGNASEGFSPSSEPVVEAESAGEPEANMLGFELVSFPEPAPESENESVAEAETTDVLEEEPAAEVESEKAIGSDEGLAEAADAPSGDIGVSGEAEATCSPTSEISPEDAYLSSLGAPDENGFYPYVRADRSRELYASVDDFIRQVLLVEAPLAMSRLERYVATFLGRDSASDEKKSINEFLKRHAPEEFFYKASFVYVRGRIVVPRRRAATRTLFSYIAPEEVEAGLLCTLNALHREDHREVTPWLLKWHTYEAFGFQSLNAASSANRRLNDALKCLEDAGKIQTDGDAAVRLAKDERDARILAASIASARTEYRGERQSASFSIIPETPSGAVLEANKILASEAAEEESALDEKLVLDGKPADMEGPVTEAGRAVKEESAKDELDFDQDSTASEEPAIDVDSAETLTPSDASAQDSDESSQAVVSDAGEVVVQTAARPQQISVPHHVLEWSPHRTLVWDPGKPNVNGFYEYKEADKTPSAYSDLDEFVYTVLWTEAPLALETLYSYAFEFLGQSPAQTNVRSEVRGILEAWSKDDICGIQGGFVYIVGRTILPRRSSRREFKNIAPKELSVGMYQMLKLLDKGTGVAPWILKSRTYEAFGHDNLTVGSLESNLLQEAIRRLEHTGRARSESGLVYKVGSVEEATISTASNAKPERVTTSAEKPAAKVSHEKPATSGKGSSKASKTVKAEVKTPERSKAEPPVTNSKLNTKAYISNLGEPDKNGFYRYVEADKSQGTRKSVDEFIRQVLVVEAPIAMTLLKRYVSTYMCSEMVSDEVNETIKDFLARHSAEGFYEESSFVYLAGRPVLPRRRTAKQMYFSYIAPEELEAGLICILERHPEAAEHTAWRIKNRTYEAFGFSRLSSSSPANRQLNDAIDRLQDEGAIRVSPNGRLYLEESGKGSRVYAQTGGVQRVQASATESNDASTKVEPAVTTAKESPHVPTQDETETVSSGTESTSSSAAAEVNSASRTVDSEVSSPEFALAAGVDGFVEYVAANKSPGLYKSLDQFVHKVLWAEAPLALEVLFDYAADYLKALPEGAYMKQSDVRKAVRNILNEWNNKNICKTREGFAYLVERPVQPRYGGGRTFEHIPFEELDLGVLAVLRSTDGVNGLKTDDLVSRTAMAFGFVQTDEFMRLRLRNAINRLYKDKQVDINDGTVCLHGRAATKTPKAAATTAQQNPCEKTPKTPETSSTTTSKPARQKAKQPVESPEPSSVTKERQAAPKKTESEPAAPAKAAGKLVQGEAQTVEEETPAQANPVDIKDESHAVKEQETMKVDADESSPASTNDSTKTDECASEASNEPDENGFYEYRAAPRQGKRYRNPAGSYAFACEIIETEAPISKILLQKYMRDYMGHRSVDSGVRGEVVRILDKGHDEAKFEERDGFIYVPGREILPRRLGPRDFNDVAPEEIDAGLASIMSRAEFEGEIGDKEDAQLIPLVSNAFGCAFLRESYTPIKEAIRRLNGNDEAGKQSVTADMPSETAISSSGSQPDASVPKELNDSLSQDVIETETTSKSELPILRSCVFREYETVDLQSDYKSSIDFLASALRRESPIEFDSLCKRFVLKYRGYSQVNSSIRRQVNAQLAAKRLASRITRKEEGKKEFLYWDWSENKKAEPRHGGDRNIADIAPEEREAGLLKELQHNKECGQISKDDLVRLTRESFGCVDSGAAKNLLNASIDSLASSGRVFLDEAGMVSLATTAEDNDSTPEQAAEDRSGTPASNSDDGSEPELKPESKSKFEREPEISSSVSPEEVAAEEEPIDIVFDRYEKVDVSNMRTWSRNDFILEAMRVEAPIRFDALCAYAGEYMHQWAESDNVRRTVSEVVRNHSSDGYFIVGGFVYKRGAIAPRHGGGRSITDIAPEELGIGMIRVLKRLDHGAGVEADLLINKTYEAFTDMPVEESIDIESYLVLDDVLVSLYKDGRLDFSKEYVSLPKQEAEGTGAEPLPAENVDATESEKAVHHASDAQATTPSTKRAEGLADIPVDASDVEEPLSELVDARADAESAPDPKAVQKHKSLRVPKGQGSMSSHSYGKRK